MSAQPINRITLIFCISTLIWVLAACGGQSESTPPPPADAPTEASTQTEASPTPTEAAEAVTTEEAKTDTAAVPTAASEATTVRRAAQLLDLRELPLPEGAEMMGQAEVGQLTYQAPLEVAAVVDFYRPLLSEQGWQENSEQSYVDTTTATLYFTQKGYAASLSASQNGDGDTLVSLLHHGNIDLRSLPQTADAEAGFIAPNTLIYVSPTDVPGVVAFTRQELAAQGWHEYSRPNSASADNADTQTLTFIQNGLELTGFITVAPAQGGKTSVQYSVILLPLDLPIPAEATKVEYDQTEPFLSLQTSAGLETLIEFYRQAMTDLGWTEVSESANIGPEEAVLAFAHEQAQTALTLSLADVDGGTKATLQPFGAEALVETEDTPAEDETMSSQPSGEMPDLPFPDDAKEVVYDADIAQITFTSPSDVNTLAEFYRQALPEQGWQEDEDFSIVEDTFGLLEFSKDEASLSITLLPDVINEGVQAVLDVSGLVPAEEIAAEPESMPSADVPGYTINDWPTPAEAFFVNRSGDELSFTIGSDLQTVADFYRPTFELMELSTSCLDDVAEYTSISCNSSNGDYTLNFFAFESGSNETEVEITFTNYALGPGDSGDTSGGDEAGPLTAVDQDGLPLPSDYTNYLSEGSEFSRRLTFTSPSAPQTLLEFYQAELAALGWEQVGNVETTAEATHLTFEGSDGKLTLEMKPSGSETEVVLTNKNPTAAAEAGILPPVGQARLYLVNLSSEELSVTINDQVIELAPEAGVTSPDDAGKLDLPPGAYKVTTQAGGSSVTDEITVGADEVWSLILNPEGAAPLQMY